MWCSGKFSEEVVLELRPYNLGECPDRKNGGEKTWGVSSAWSRTKRKPMWMGYREWGDGTEKKSEGRGRQGPGAIGPERPWKGLRFYSRNKKWTLSSKSKDGLILILQIAFWPLGGEQTGLRQKWNQEAREEALPCSGENLDSGGHSGNGELWADLGHVWEVECWRWKRGERDQWWHSFLASAKPFGLNASSRFCLWVSLTTDITSASKPNLGWDSFQLKWELG